MVNLTIQRENKNNFKNATISWSKNWKFIYMFYENFTIKYCYVTGKEPHISPLRCGIIISGRTEDIAFTTVIFCWLLGYVTFLCRYSTYISALFI